MPQACGTHRAGRACDDPGAPGFPFSNLGSLPGAQTVAVSWLVPLVTVPAGISGPPMLALSQWVGVGVRTSALEAVGSGTLPHPRPGLLWRLARRVAHFPKNPAFADLWLLAPISGTRFLSLHRGSHGWPPRRGQHAHESLIHL